MSDQEPITNIFKDKSHVAKYADGPKRFVPGLEAMHRIMAQLLRETSPESVLLLGGGGGLEAKSLMEALPNARFCAVDPSGEMIEQGKIYVDQSDRVDWVEGYIFDAPEGPFEAATCLLTLHFVPDDGGKLDTLKAVRARLKSGAPFFLAHLAIDRFSPSTDAQFARYAQYAEDNGLDPAMVEKARTSVKALLNCVSPERDAALLHEAGFTDVELVFKGLYWCGWIAYA